MIAITFGVDISIIICGGIQGDGNGPLVLLLRKQYAAFFPYLRYFKHEVVFCMVDLQTNAIAQFVVYVFNFIWYRALIKSMKIS